MVGSAVAAPVVVGVNGSGPAAGAVVEWAAAEAAARRRPLRIAHVHNPPPVVDPFGVVPMFDAVAAARRAADQLVQHATARARGVAPEVEVWGRVFNGPTAAALRHVSRDAALLVLGAHRGGVRGPGGGVAARLAGRCACPVVVVRGLLERAHADMPPRVVVGIGSGDIGAPALAVAFQAAAQRGVPLTAVRAWDPSRPRADRAVIGAPPGDAEAVAARRLERALGPWRDWFSEVAVATRLVRGDPAAALVAESRGAALLVVGSRGRGSIRGVVFGSVSRAVGRRADCSLVVVPDQVRAGGWDPRRHGRGIRPWQRPFRVGSEHSWGGTWRA
jgi:nucleotide-binding universal stress UspA family protein